MDIGFGAFVLSRGKRVAARSIRGPPARRNRDAKSRVVSSIRGVGNLAEKWLVQLPTAPFPLRCCCGLCCGLNGAHATHCNVRCGDCSKATRNSSSIHLGLVGMPVSCLRGRGRVLLQLSRLWNLPGPAMGARRRE